MHAPDGPSRRRGQESVVATGLARPHAGGVSSIPVLHGQSTVSGCRAHGLCHSHGTLIDKTFPFDQTLDALAYVEQGRANGKVVITLD
jgi:hypothetical protein